MGDTHTTSDQQAPDQGDAPEAPKKKVREVSDYIPSDQVRALQRLLESQEKKRVYVLMLQAKVNQGEVMIENESKTIEKEAERKRLSLQLEIERANKAFEERFQQITSEENAAIGALRHSVNLVRDAFEREQKALGQINTQIGRELTKMGVIQLSPAEQLPVKA